MTGQQIYQLGKSSPAARACIPLEFSPTAPLLSFCNGWIAEFWYYFANVQSQSLSEPQYYLALELPSGHPTKMLQLRETPAHIGNAPELITQEYYKKINDYLAFCAHQLENPIPSGEVISALHEQWLATLPAALRQWFDESEGAMQPPQPHAPSVPPATPVPEDPVHHWKKEMAKAIQEGDPQAVRKAQQEMKKANKKQ